MIILVIKSLLKHSSPIGSVSCSVGKRSTRYTIITHIVLSQHICSSLSTPGPGTEDHQWDTNPSMQRIEHQCRTRIAKILQSLVENGTTVPPRWLNATDILCKVTRCTFFKYTTVLHVYWIIQPVLVYKCAVYNCSCWTPSEMSQHIYMHSHTHTRAHTRKLPHSCAYAHLFMHAHCHFSHTPARTLSARMHTHLYAHTHKHTCTQTDARA